MDDKDTATLRSDAQEELKRLMDDHLAVIIVGITRDKTNPNQAITSTSLMRIKDEADTAKEDKKELTFKETLTGAIQCLVYTALTTLPPKLVLGVLTETIQQYAEDTENDLEGVSPYGPN